MKESDFLLALNLVLVQRFSQRALKEIEYNIDVALNMFNDGIIIAIQCMKKRVKVTKTDARENDWFDKECREKRRKKNSSKLCKFRRTHNPQHRQVHTESRSEYIALPKQKKKECKQHKSKILAKKQTILKPSGRN